MKKILNVVFGSLSSRKGGVGRVVSLLSFYFNEDFCILTNNYDPQNPPFEFSKKTRICPFLKGHNSISLLINSPLNFFTGVQLARQERIQILLAHKWLPLLYTTALKAALGSRVQNYGIIYNAEDFKIDRTDPLSSKIIKNILFVFFKIACKLNFVDGIIVLNNEIKTSALNLLHFNKIHVWRIGVSKELLEEIKATEKSPDRTTESSDSPAFKLLFHGMLMPRRRLEDVIEALRYTGAERKIALYVSGNADTFKDYVNYLKKIIQKYGVAERIFFLGETPESKFINLLRSCDAFIFPCIDQSWGIAPLEAMALGKTAIVTTSSGVSEVLEDGVTAVVVVPKNPALLAQKIKLLYDNPSLRKKIGMNAKSFILSKMTYVNTGDQLIRIFG